LGKLPNIDLDRMAAAVHRARFREAPFSFEIALAAAKLPLIHRDPFDRLILAQARTEGSTIVSSDSVFQAYGAALLW
jgi:PIN domain nuclease of toxin-antitoxin system